MLILCERNTLQYCPPLPPVHKVPAAIRFLPYLKKYQGFWEGEKNVCCDKYGMGIRIYRFSLEVMSVVLGR